MDKLTQIINQIQNTPYRQSLYIRLSEDGYHIASELSQEQLETLSKQLDSVLAEIPEAMKRPLFGEVNDAYFKFLVFRNLIESHLKNLRERTPEWYVSRIEQIRTKVARNEELGADLMCAFSGAKYFQYHGRLTQEQVNELEHLGDVNRLGHKARRHEKMRRERNPEWYERKLQEAKAYGPDAPEFRTILDELTINSWDYRNAGCLTSEQEARIERLKTEYLERHGPVLLEPGYQIGFLPD